jgi:hypothetical protein
MQVFERPQKEFDQVLNDIYSQIIGEMNIVEAKKCFCIDI